MSKSDVAAVAARSIGQSLPRKEDATILSGRSEYVADLNLPGTLHCAFLRSPFAHATIQAIRIYGGTRAAGCRRDLDGPRRRALHRGDPGRLTGRRFYRHDAASTCDRHGPLCG